MLTLVGYAKKYRDITLVIALYRGLVIELRSRAKNGESRALALDSPFFALDRRSITLKNPVIEISRYRARSQLPR